MSNEMTETEKLLREWRAEHGESWYADELKQALARDRAAMGEAVLVPTHYAENLLAAACLLENTGELLNKREAAVLRKIADTLYTRPPVAGDALSLVEQPSGVAPDEKFGWKCNNCHTVFMAWKAERDPGDSNGGAPCPYCKADGQYTYRCELHQGDPCNRCGTPHDEVKKGPCTGTPPAGDAQARVEVTDEATTERRALLWLAGDDSGMSSIAIVHHMLGMESDGSFPWDPSDLGRCLRMLELFPEWKPRIGEMARYSEQWARISAKWDELAAMMADEVGIDWSKGKKAPKTYAALTAALEGEVVTHQESLLAMHEFTEANLPELCAELVEWHSTTLLRDGRMRELARLCTFDADHQLRQAERMVELHALRRIAQGAQDAKG